MSIRPSTVGPLGPATETRLHEALTAFQTAFRAGQAPERAEFLAAHADVAGPLGRALDAWLALQNGLGLPVLSAEEVPERLGDFILLREVGRGGMGVVFEAEQVSLGRRVAVKVLGRSAAFSELERLRFRQEAQATALLHHPHIVATYFAGEEDVLYYAMQYIEGRALADVLHRARSGADAPAPEDVVRWIEQAAQALDHAHERGFVHRDVKPSNLLLDLGGHVWLTDFGLAYSQQRDGAARPNAAGTPGYLSPEQLGLSPAPVDRRADVFALGVTLYELLTLHAPFAGVTHTEYREALRTQEAPRPRRHRPELPRDLETITLKALAKEPAERYATARALAEDLRRYRECRPVLAHPPTLWQRASKLLRRRRRLAAVVGMVAVLVAVGTAALLVRAHEREKRLRAERQFARQFAGELTHIAEELLSVTPQKGLLRREVLEKAAAYYEYVAQEPDASAADRHAVGVAHYRLGNLTYHQADYRQSLAAHEKALAIFRTLAAEHPDEPRYRFDIFHTLTVLAGSQAGMKEPLEVRDRTQREALEVIEALAAEHPEPKYLDALAAAHFDTGRALQATPAAEPHFRRALELGDTLARQHPEKANFYRRNIARGHLGLAQYFLACHARIPEMKRHYRAAIDLYAVLAASEPVHGRVRREMERDRASWQLTLAEWCHRTGELEPAHALCREAVSTLTALADDLPDQPGCRLLKVEALRQWAEILADLGRADEAEAVYRRFRREAEECVAQHESSSGVLHGLLWLLADCPSAPLRAPDEAASRAEQWLARHPEDREAGFLRGLAELRAGRADAAKASLRAVVGRGGASPAAYFALAAACARDGDRDESRRWYDCGNEHLHPFAHCPDVRAARLRCEAARLLGIPP